MNDVFKFNKKKALPFTKMYLSIYLCLVHWGYRIYLMHLCRIRHQSTNLLDDCKQSLNRALDLELWGM